MGEFDSDRWRVLDQTVEGLRRDDGDLSAEELDVLIEESLAEVRAQRRGSG